MDVLIFGTGELYRKRKNFFRDDITIVAFLDNNIEKQGKLFDGYMVFSPERVNELKYDKIFLLSSYCADMREQLYHLGVCDDKILDINRSSLILKNHKTELYGDLVSNQGKNVLVFTPSLTSTGAQNALFTLVLILKKYHYHVCVVSAEDGIQRDKYLKQGVGLIVSDDIIAEKELLTMLAQYSDFILVNTLWLYYLVDYYKDFGKKIIWWIHETATIHDVSKRVFRRIAAAEYVEILSVGELIDKNIWELYGDDISVRRLLFGLRDYVKVFSPAKNSKMTIACIGGISEIKGQDLFIDAIELLPKKLKDKAVFWIIGSGNLCEHYQDIVDRTACIKQLGEIENEKMPDIYAELDGVACCSRKESMSIAVAEACMNGKFAIVSNAAGITAMLEDRRNAMLFESGSAKELSVIIAWAIQNRAETRRIGIASRCIFEKYFTLDKFENQLREYIEL